MPVGRSCCSVSERWARLFHVCVSILLGVDVQCSRREEKPRAVCHWLAERASPTLRASTGHGAASPVGWMVHRISKICNITHGCNYLKVSHYRKYVYYGLKIFKLSLPTQRMREENWFCILVAAHKLVICGSCRLFTFSSCHDVTLGVICTGRHPLHINTPPCLGVIRFKIYML